MTEYGLVTSNMTGSDMYRRHTADMYLIELARVIQQDKERRIQEAGRRRRLLERPAPHETDRSEPLRSPLAQRPASTPPAAR